jgi:hypothetical protein
MGILVASLIAWVVIGAIVGFAIGKAKGRGAAGFFLGFFLGGLGLIIIAVMEPTVEVEANRQAMVETALRKGNDGQAQSKPGDNRICPWCAETIKAAAVICRYCGRDVEPVPTPESEVSTASAPFCCPNCGAVMTLSGQSQSVTCSSCRNTYDFCECPRCDLPQSVPRGISTKCQSCSATLKARAWLPPTTFGAVLAQAST